jgi:hypothetical protein|tara:strand:- start:113 stop:817 length:705 start_codon:yes stop_codon:yes gene_type:complete
MKIAPNIEMLGLGMKVYDTLVLSDLHIGYEEALNKGGVMIPRFQFDEIMKELEDLVKKAGNLRRIVINGDLKHEFGTISNQEWRHTLKVLDFLSSQAEVILVQGNHDTILGPIAQKREILVVDHFIDRDVMYVHGNKIVDIPDEVNTLVIGHEHPAVRIGDNSRSELFKCYLVGKYKDKKLIVLPSFHFVTEGHDMLKEKVLSPYLKQDISDFKVIVVGDEMMNFGELSSLAQN